MALQLVSISAQYKAIGVALKNAKYAAANAVNPPENVYYDFEGASDAYIQLCFSDGWVSFGGSDTATFGWKGRLVEDVDADVGSPEFSVLLHEISKPAVE
jgi:hypothetical protein